MSREDETPIAGHKTPRSSKKLLDRFINAVIKEFKPELDELSTRYSPPPTRICRGCQKPDDPVIFYAFEKPGLCDRCEEKITAVDSVAINEMVFR